MWNYVIIVMLQCKLHHVHVLYLTVVTFSTLELNLAICTGT